MLRDLADVALREQPQDNVMVAISQAWYNGSYTMAAKAIKSLELHYTMIQFLTSSDVRMIKSNSWEELWLCYLPFDFC